MMIKAVMTLLPEEQKCLLVCCVPVFTFSFIWHSSEQLMMNSHTYLHTNTNFTGVFIYTLSTIRPRKKLANASIPLGLFKDLKSTITMQAHLAPPGPLWACWRVSVSWRNSQSNLWWMTVWVSDVELMDTSACTSPSIYRVWLLC